MRRCIMRRIKEEGNFFCRGNWLRLAGYVFEMLTSRFLFFKINRGGESVIGYIVGIIFLFYQNILKRWNQWSIILGCFYLRFFSSSKYKFFESDSKWKDSNCN